MARTSRAERNKRHESALTLVSQSKGFSDVVTAQMSQWGCSRSSAQRDCRWAHDQLQLSIDSHDVQHLIVHMATSLQRNNSPAPVKGCCEVSQTPHCIRSSAHLLGTVATESFAERPLYQIGSQPASTTRCISFAKPRIAITWLCTKHKTKLN